MRCSHFAGDEDTTIWKCTWALRSVASHVRVHYAPDYFGSGVELCTSKSTAACRSGNAVRCCSTRARAHDEWNERGVHDYVPGRPAPTRHTRATSARSNGTGTRLDVRTGVSLATRLCDVSLSWQARDGDDATAYQRLESQDARAGCWAACITGSSPSRAGFALSCIEPRKEDLPWDAPRCSRCCSAPPASRAPRPATAARRVLRTRPRTARGCHASPPAAGCGGGPRVDGCAPASRRARTRRGRRDRRRGHRGAHRGVAPAPGRRAVRVYEAQARVGGRMLSLRNHFPDGQVIELAVN